MKVLLLNDGGYGDAEGVKFPVEVEALSLNNGYFKIHKDELHRVGFVGFDNHEEWGFGKLYEAVLVEQPNETPCIRDMCCNQFGERDEMQRIINSLQADVIARGARITDLEREVERLESQRASLIAQVAIM